MARTQRRHPVHQYVRKELKRKMTDEPYVIFRCMIPGCTHYLREELAEGQKSICNRCGKDFILTKAAMELKKPHCVECTRGYKRKGKLDERVSVADIALNLDKLLEG